MYNAIEPRFRSEVIAEDGPPVNPGPPHESSRFLKRRITTAVRWADIQGKIGWAGVVLGEVLPAFLFDSHKFSHARWQELSLALAEFSDQIAGDAMRLLEMELLKEGMLAEPPSKLLGNAPAPEFGRWIDGFVGNDCGNRTSLESVAWVAGRIAQRWDHDTPTPYLFEKLKASHGPTTWPAAGRMATNTMDPSAWDICEGHSAPLCLAPFEQVISAIVPGRRFGFFYQRHCPKCMRALSCSDTKTRDDVSAESATFLQPALDELLVVPVHLFS
jgi:hypothetical protein